jgi:hypothetical protein
MVSQTGTAPYRVEQGVIRTARGIPRGPRWLADGRLAFSWDEQGVGRVEYYAPRAHDGNPVFFERGIFESFRLFLLADGLTYAPAYENTALLPYALTAEWRVEGAVFTLGVYCVDASMVFRVVTPETLPQNFTLALRFYEGTQLTPAETGDFHVSGRGTARAWQAWRQVEDALVGGCVDLPSDGQAATGTTWRLGASTGFTWSRTAHNGCHTLKTGGLAPGRAYLFALTPDPDPEACRSRNRQLLEGFDAALASQGRRYGDAGGRSPTLDCAAPGLGRFFQLAPLYHESLKVTEAPGALRAKTTRYWVWGWDAMISNCASFYWGDGDWIKAMLGFMEATAHPEGGIPHAFTQANTPASLMERPAQGMYICLLHHYFQATGDADTVGRFYPFALQILNRMMEAALPEKGLFAGTSLFPDFPAFMEETGKDVSLYNNALAYCALRAMEVLAALAGDRATETRLQNFLRQTRENFAETFFEPRLGTFVNSVDAETFARRNSVNVGALMWENDFAGELVYQRDAACLAFIERHCVGKAYLRAIPLWDAAFDGDGNQLHCTWPVVDESFVRLANRAGKGDLLQTWAGWVSYWTDQLLCPEGVSYLVETETPATDRWNCEPGTWQAYSLRKWYQDIVHGYLGLVPDWGGFTFAPGGAGGYALQNFHWQGRAYRVLCQGAGAFVEWIESGGKRYEGLWKLPLGWIEGGRVFVKLCEAPAWDYEALGCYGAQVTQWRREAAGAALGLRGYGTGLVTLRARKPCRVTVDGREEGRGQGVIRVWARLEKDRETVVRLYGL